MIDLQEELKKYSNVIWNSKMEIQTAKLLLNEKNISALSDFFEKSIDDVAEIIDSNGVDYFYCNSEIENGVYVVSTKSKTVHVLKSVNLCSCRSKPTKAAIFCKHVMTCFVAEALGRICKTPMPENDSYKYIWEAFLLPADE